MSGYENLSEQCSKNLIIYTKHLENLRKNIEDIEQAKLLLLEVNPSIDISDFIEMEQFNNYNGYVTIAILELSVNLKNLILSKTDWGKAFFIKNSFLTIHETAKKLKPFKGKSIIENTVKRNFSALEADLQSLFDKIDTFRNDDKYKKISTTRHTIAGHIEDSLKVYYDAVMKLDGEEAGCLISKFLKILNKALFLTSDYAIMADVHQKEKSQVIDSTLRSLLTKIQDLIKE